MYLPGLIIGHDLFGFKTSIILNWGNEYGSRRLRMIGGYCKETDSTCIVIKSSIYFTRLDVFLE
jgi:hypothetical protein